MICLSLAERVEFSEVNTHMLENWIDEMTAQLPPLKNFILPVSVGIGWDGVSVGVFPCWILCVCVCVYLCLHMCVCYMCVCVCLFAWLYEYLLECVCVCVCSINCACTFKLRLHI